VAALPPFETASAGNKDIFVGDGQAVTIAAGKYRHIVLLHDATLTFTGGIYDIASLWIEDRSKAVFNASSKVRIRYGFAADDRAYVGPANGSSIDATQIVFFVGGADALFPFTRGAGFGPNGTVYANFYAPNGTLAMDDGVQATGSFIARNIVIGKKVQITLANSFTGLTKSSGDVWTLEPGGSTATEQIPTEYALGQNYPNPFNPTTTIAFQVAGSGLQDVQLMVYDLLGREVTTLVNEPRGPGNYRLQFDARNLASGMYIYRLTVGGFVESRHMILLK
jgi:hypothetical protein